MLNDFPLPSDYFFTVNRHENIDISENRGISKSPEPPNRQTIMDPLLVKHCQLLAKQTFSDAKLIKVF
jgi:hypothetical protein